MCRSSEQRCDAIKRMGFPDTLSRLAFPAPVTDDGWRALNHTGRMARMAQRGYKRLAGR